MKDQRIVEVQTEDGWEQIEMKELVPGDTFRMFESTGEPVIGAGGKEDWIVCGLPYINEENGVWEVEVF